MHQYSLAVLQEKEASILQNHQNILVLGAKLDTKYHQINHGKFIIQLLTFLYPMTIHL